MFRRTPLVALCSFAFLAIAAGLSQADLDKRVKPPPHHETEWASENQTGAENLSGATAPVLPGVNGAESGDLNTTPNYQESEGNQERAQASEKTTWYNFVFDPQAVFNGLIVIFTAVLAGVAWHQSHILNRTLVATENAANAAQRGVDVASNSAKAQLRAYLSVTPHFAGNFGTAHPPHYTIVIRNTGQTPAYDVRAWTDGVLADHPLTDEIPERNETLFPNPRRPLNPGSQDEITGFFGGQIRSEDLPRIMLGELRYYFWGEVTYMDAFGEQRYARFRYMFGGVGTRVGGVDICEDGNEAN